MLAMTWKVIAAIKRSLLISGIESNSINVLVNFLADDSSRVQKSGKT
jgi:hypothetical protein